MQRREFITLIGSAAVAWPFTARAQQSAVPVVGYLYSGSPEAGASLVAGFRKGLSEQGFSEGHNVAIEYRWANNDPERLPELAADLVRRRVAVIVAPGASAGVLAAKAATTTIPIVFRTGGDPVELGLVTSLNQPGGNVTGINAMSLETVTKRLGLLHELLPAAARFAVLFNPNDPNAGPYTKELQEAASAIGRQIEFFGASNIREIDLAFVGLAQRRPDAILVVAQALLINRRVQIVTQATRHTLPAIYPNRDFAEVGGLMSYGPDSADQFRLTGTYAGRVLKGEKPQDLPVLRASKFELVINLQTAKALGIDIPTSLLAFELVINLKTANALGLTISRDLLLIADEVIE
jgi:putative ABC transport system substrate-binding protein